VPKSKNVAPSVSEADPPVQIPEELVDQLLASVKHPSELLSSNGLMRQLMSRLVQKCLDAELTDHLGYEAGQKRLSTNTRNGRSAKTVQTEAGPIAIDVPRDREGTFEPVLIPKHQRRLESFDERILALYARGMSTRQIQDFFQETYGAEVSPQLVSRVTDSALSDVEEWRHRKLEEVYPIVYLDGLQVKVKTDGVVQPRVVYVALGVTREGKKEVLGLWMAATEGAKFWLSVVTELHNRGVLDILIACCDGLKGFPEAIEAVFPRTVVQTCVVHQIRNSLKYVAWGARKQVAADLRPIYQADTEEAARAALEAFETHWGDAYPSIGKSWRDNWTRLSPFFAFPREIRRAIYTTNAIEALNSQLRQTVHPKRHFPSEEAVYKVLFLALRLAEKKWTMPIRHWDRALQQFAIRFENRLPL
jgi:putative transposase